MSALEIILIVAVVIFAATTFVSIGVAMYLMKVLAGLWERR